MRDVNDANGVNDELAEEFEPNDPRFQPAPKPTQNFERKWDSPLTTRGDVRRKEFYGVTRKMNIGLFLFFFAIFVAGGIFLAVRSSHHKQEPQLEQVFNLLGDETVFPWNPNQTTFCHATAAIAKVPFFTAAGLDISEVKSHIQDLEHLVTADPNIASQESNQQMLMDLGALSGSLSAVTGSAHAVGLSPTGLIAHTSLGHTFLSDDASAALSC